ncbi:hypothetical protein C7974DRAFT_44385 [Boeremia exigua]|uniref:uncharacterized protein n=1 Tax=Boeremia exigua TaxID=749465 RepID=UPI001E8D0E6D|nr:uncharacterized protein C7974DRAFT_44385 [Boeremia exigua]KAH6616407.1 hypothetical protein C7974DRAFT_44385 [Boeremia exigua]
MSPQGEHRSPPPEYSAEAPPQVRASPHAQAPNDFDEGVSGAEPSATTLIDGVQQQVEAPADGSRVAKRRKQSVGGEAANGGPENDLRLRAADLELRGEHLALRVLLNDKEATISRLRLKYEEHKVVHLREQTRLRKDLNNAVAVHNESSDTMKKEVLGLKIEANELKKEINKRDARILGLEQQLDHLSLAYTRAPAKHREPSLAPDPNQAVREHPEYKHPEAPRQNPTYMGFNCKVTYPVGTGKVWVGSYGSTKYWDLGLCRSHFEYGKVCHVRGCEYRHEPLTTNEQIYIGLLEPKGPKFLRDVAICNVARRNKVLL